MKQLVLAAFAIGLLPLAVLALDQRTIAERCERLKNMSEVERDRLNRNIAEFQKLNPAEKQRYRDLHQQLADDQVKSGGLTSLLKTYFVWLQTLSPSQRDELAREKVPSQKLVLIRQFKELQEHSIEASEQHESTDGQAPRTARADDQVPVSRASIGPNVALSSKDLKAVLKVLVDRLPADVKSGLEDLKLTAHIPTIHASVQASGGNYREWPDELLLKDMISAIGKDSMPSIKIAESKRAAILRLMLLGIFKQAVEAVPMPGPDDKTRILESMPAEEKSKLLTLSRQKMEMILYHKFLESRGTNDIKTAKDVPVYREQLIDLFGRFEIPLPPRFTKGKTGGIRIPNPGGNTQH